MAEPQAEDEVIRKLVEWAENQPLVRAAILTSTRAVPNAALDIFSDYDVILTVDDVRPFYEDRTWLKTFGPVLVLYRDPLESQAGSMKSGYVTQYENGLKIDFNLWSIDIMEQVVTESELPPEFDAGYSVLIDKDHLTSGLKAPTYQAYIPTPPSEGEFHDAIEEFFLEASYVAKYLWRDDLIAALHVLDHYMKQEHLLPMLGWHLETEHGWNVKTGLYGRGLKKWLRPDLWAELGATYTGFGLESIWDAMVATIQLFRKVALEVGCRLGYPYPHELDQRVEAYLQVVSNLDCNATRFDGQ